ncbi:MAG: ThuA domain-containing protein [Verrucomicrobiales bacterium]|nr:ThuA domain-containing protein [Verrucomicrobiales bacterium]
MFPRLLAVVCWAWLVLIPRLDAASPDPVRILVWDERQPRQKDAYTNWLGNQIAAHLQTIPGLSVRSAAMDDPQQGLADLDHTDVLVWWGHVRQMEIEPPVARDIVRRILEGRLSLVALHSAHWSRPFVEAMNERARRDAVNALPPGERATAVLVETNLMPRPLMAPKYSDRLTPSVLYRKPIGAPVQIELTLPNCCFPAYRGDGKPSEIRVLLPGHPIARGLPPVFTLSQTEMYDEPFHVPPPDEVVLEERWAGGEWFRSGMVWNLGKGRVFYFRPGHETYPVYFDAHALAVIANACQWLGQR